MLPEEEVMSFWAIYEGQGEGCDYTIGCNMSFERLDAATLIEAKTEALEAYTDTGGREDRYERITVLEVVGEHDLAAEMRAMVADRQREAADREKAAKRVQLEKLRRELGE